MYRVVLPWPLIRALIVSATCTLAAQNAAAANLDGSGVSPDVLSLPKGPGSIEGLGAAFQPNLATGTGAYSIAIEVPPGPAGIKPQLALGYQSGRGNGVCGVGWDLDLPRVQRRVDEGLPEYQDADTFLSPEGEPLLVQSDQSWRSQIETTFSRFWYYSTTGWKEELKNGRSRRYGRSANARISNVLGRTSQDFAWLLEEEADINGNTIRYVYQRDAGQLYLSEVHWAERKGQLGHVVRLEYEDRPDALSDYRSTFAVVTARRLHSISVATNGEDVRSYQLDYDDSSGSSLLSRVTKFDRTGKVKYPAIEQLKYSNFAPRAVDVRSLSGVPPVGFGAQAELADLDGDGLPDIVHTELGRHTWRRNEGSDHFADERAFSDLSFALGSGAQLADIDGDGQVDLLVQPSQNPDDTRYFPGSGSAHWGDPVFFTGPSFAADISDSSLRFVDVDFDKRVDAVVTTADSFLVWRNQEASSGTGTTWMYQGPIPLPEAGISFSDASGPDANTELADMNGDRLLDLVELRPAGVRYFPHRGRMAFDSPVDMSGVPALDTSSGLWRLVDVNGDGLSDLVLVGEHLVELRLNQKGSGFGKPVTVQDTPGIVDGTTVRFADVNGSGTTDVIWARADGWSYLELCAQGVPNLLVQVDNGLGKSTALSYESSSELDAADAAAGRAWVSHVPMPVQLLTAIATRDLASGVVQKSTFDYRDGYYDGSRKQFRGFGAVVQTNVGDASTPDLVTESDFDVGRRDEALKGHEILSERRDTLGRVFEQTATTYEVRVLPSGGQAAFPGAQEKRILELAKVPTVIRDEYTTDSYGNLILNKSLGNVNVSGDERITKRAFVPLDGSLAATSQHWLLDRVQREEVEDGNGHTQSVSYSYYDGDPFVGLPLGKIAAGNLTRTRGCLGPPVDNFTESRCSVETMRRAYDSLGNVIGSEDAEGGKREYAYDSQLQTYPVSEAVLLGDRSLTFAATYDLGFGVPLTSTDPSGAVSQYTYDDFGRLVGIAKPLDDPRHPSVSYEYDVTAPLSRRITHRTQSDTAVETKVECVDGMGRTVKTLESVGDQGYLAAGAVAFDARGNVALQYHPQFVKHDGCAAALDDSVVITSRFDATGRILETENFDGSKTRSSYAPLQVTNWDEEDTAAKSSHLDTPTVRRSDGLGRLVELDEQLGQERVTTLFGYDARGQRVSVTDALGAEITWVYDGLGRVRSVDHPDAGHISYTYDKAGRRLTQTDARGRTISWTYDIAGRVTSKQHEKDLGSVAEEYHYDDPSLEQPAMAFTTGKLSWVSDTSGARYVGYDAEGRVSIVTRRIGGHDFTERSVFDHADHEIWRMRPDGSVLSFNYDLRGQISGIDGVIDQIDFDEFGHPTSEAQHNGVISTMAYDSRGRLLKSSVLGPTGVHLQQFSYDLDGVGNILTVTDASEAEVDGAASRLDSWTYDYDDLYRLTTAKTRSGSLSYAYAEDGTLQKIDADGSEAPARSHRYSYGSAQPHAPSAIDDLPVSVDASGNWLNDGQHSLAWDSESRLASVSNAEGVELARYSYDAEGNRAIRHTSAQDDYFVFPDYEVRGPKATAYAMIGNRRVAWSTTDVQYTTPVDIAPIDLKSDNQATEAADGFIDAGDAVVLLQVVKGSLVIDDAPGVDVDGDGTVSEADVRALLRIVVGAGGHAPTTFAVSDHLGSTTLELDQAGEATSIRRYQPYGALRSISGQGSPYGYTGKEQDAESALSYFGARYLQPEVGLWTAVDPASVVPTSSFLERFCAYGAFSDSPIRFVDPDGRESEQAAATISSGNVSGGASVPIGYTQRAIFAGYGVASLVTNVAGQLGAKVLASLPAVIRQASQAYSGVRSAISLGEPARVGAEEVSRGLDEAMGSGDVGRLDRVTRHVADQVERLQMNLTRSLTAERALIFDSFRVAAKGNLDQDDLHIWQVGRTQTTVSETAHDTAPEAAPSPTAASDDARSPPTDESPVRRPLP